MTGFRMSLVTKLLSLVAAIAFVVSCTGGAPGARPAQEAKGDDKPLDPPVAVAVGAIAGLSDAGLFVALERGYFKEQGLNVEIVNFDTAAKMVAPMATGQLDVGSGATAASMFNAYKRDIPIRIVADKGSTPKGFGFAALVIRKDLIDSGAVKDYPDLKGRTFAVSSQQSTPAIELDKALQKGNVRFDEIKIVEMAFPDMAAAFANKNVDGAIQIEPIMTQVVERGLTVRWKGVDELYPNSQVALILYGPNFTQSKPEAAKRFMVGYVKALRDYNDAFAKNKGKAEVVSVLAKYTALKDTAVYDKVTPVGFNPDGYVNRESIASDQDWFAAHGMVNQKVDINEMIDNQYVEYAVKRLGKYQ